MEKQEKKRPAYALRLLYLIPGLLAAAAWYILRDHPDIIENIYSQKIYPVLTNMFVWTNSWAWFSFSEILLYGLAAFAVFFAVAVIVFLFRKGRGRRILNLFTSLVALVSFGVFIFVFGWGLNYYRYPLSTIMDVKTEKYTVEELSEVCGVLADRANGLRENTSEDENGVYRMSASFGSVASRVEEIYFEAPEYMRSCAQTRIKGVYTKNLMSVSQTMGIFSPFTYECNVNPYMPDLYIPSTAVHEYAHLMGFAREDECNFIAFYLTSRSVDTDFGYSGTVLALTHSMNTLYRYDRELYKKAYGTLSDKVKADLKNDSLYWDQFETDFAEATDEAYDSYLKANGVTDGKKSYGRMVDLLIATYKEGMWE